MASSRVGGYQKQVRSHLRTAFSEDHPPHQIAVSFAIGVFVTALPSLGTGVAVLAAIGYYCSWANRLALFAAVAILNPLAKSAVYVASFALGRALLGPIPEITEGDVDLSLSAGSEAVVRLLVGNVILAVLFAVVGYFVALRGVRAYRQRTR